MITANFYFVTGRYKTLNITRLPRVGEHVEFSFLNDAYEVKKIVHRVEDGTVDIYLE